MPKRTSRKRAPGRGKALSDTTDRTITVRGVYRAAVAPVAQIDGILLNPLALDQRLIDLSDTYQEFRFTRIKAQLWNFTTAYEVSLAYMPTLASAAPTFATLPSLSAYATGNGQYGTPNPCLRLSRSMLTANAPKWFRRGTAFDDLFETQGVIYRGSAVNFSTQPATFLMYYEVQLRGKADVSITRPVPSALRSSKATLEEKVAELANLSSCYDRELQYQVLHPEGKEQPGMTTAQPAPLGAAPVVPPAHHGPVVAVQPDSPSEGPWLHVSAAAKAAPPTAVRKAL